MEAILAQLALAAFNQVQKAIELQLAHNRGEKITTEQVQSIQNELDNNSAMIQQLRQKVE